MASRTSGPCSSRPRPWPIRAKVAFNAFPSERRAGAVAAGVGEGARGRRRGGHGVDGGQDRRGALRRSELERRRDVVGPPRHPREHVLAGFEAERAAVAGVRKVEALDVRDRDRRLGPHDVDVAAAEALVARHLEVVAELRTGRVVVLAQPAAALHGLERDGQRGLDRLVAVLHRERRARVLDEPGPAARELAGLGPRRRHAECRLEVAPAAHGVVLGPLYREARPHLVERRLRLLDGDGVALRVKADDAPVGGEQEQAVARLAVSRGEHPRLAADALPLLVARRGHVVTGQVALRVGRDGHAHRSGEERHRHRRAVLRACRRGEEVAVPDAVLLGLVRAPRGRMSHRDAVVPAEVGHERLGVAPAAGRQRGERGEGAENERPATRAGSSALPS